MMLMFVLLDKGIDIFVEVMGLFEEYDGRMFELVEL